MSQVLEFHKEVKGPQFETYNTLYCPVLLRNTVCIGVAWVNLAVVTSSVCSASSVLISNKSLFTGAPVRSLSIQNQ